MWDYKYRKSLKVVEARAKCRGAHVLLTVSATSAKLSMNGPVLISHYETDTFTDDLNNAIKTAREILEAN